jgi:acyl carrier protein
MTKEQFLKRLNGELMFSTNVKESDILSEIDEWDSLAMLNVLNVFDELGINIEIDEIESCKSVKDILTKANVDS